MVIYELNKWHIEELNFTHKQPIDMFLQLMLCVVLCVSEQVMKNLLAFSRSEVKMYFYFYVH